VVPVAEGISRVPVEDASRPKSAGAVDHRRRDTCKLFSGSTVASRYHRSSRPRRRQIHHELVDRSGVHRRRSQSRSRIVSPGAIRFQVVGWRGVRVTGLLSYQRNRKIDACKANAG